jgi:predicted amidohydrolase
MKMALAQIRCLPGEIAANVRTIVESIRDAAERGCDAVVFPEMSDTGYHMPTIARTASAWNGAAYTEIAAAAARFKISVLAGLSERVGNDIYNTIAVIGADGAPIAKYRKTHLMTGAPICEHNFLRSGNEITLCTLGSFKIGLMTCYDIRFPELARRLCLQGAEVLVVPAAWPMYRLGHWETINACRAIENQVYVAAVNRVGTDKGLAFCGASRLLDPYGTILASASPLDDTLIVGEISRERLREVRGRLKVYEDRREELYRFP